jgi:peptidoglycan/xylan/chitin deacetylase (PgdA/CDA1 family)
MMNIARKAGTKFKNQLSPHGLILMYHRIAELELDPWGLSVSPRHFAEHVEVIRKYFHPLSMPEFVKHLQRGKVPNRSVVITFDDGYADNLYNAKPILERHDISATIYLVTEALVEKRNFWWDDLESVLLQPDHLPESLELNLHGSQYSWQLGNARRYTTADRQNDRQLRPWNASPGTRMAFFYAVWQQLRQLSKPERLEAIEMIRDWAGMSQKGQNAARILTKEELHRLENGSLIELGAHTVTHPSLPTLSAGQQIEEIVGGKAQLESILGHPVTSFSYPHGEYSPKTINLVRNAGFHSATAIHFRCVFSGADPFELPRFQVDDWSGEKFLRHLIRWYAFH